MADTAAFATSFISVYGTRPINRAVCNAGPRTLTMSVESTEDKKDTPVLTAGPVEPNLAPRFNSTSLVKDGRSFKIMYQVPAATRLYSVRELQDSYLTKTVPFARWYSEQVNIHKSGGKILKIERVSGVALAEVGMGLATS
jgi:hypothetical protein